MTETPFTRARRASLYGLLLQVLAFAAALGLAQYVGAWSLQTFAWYVLGGVPIWLCAVLVFKQRESAALEAMDLDELRRERRRTGGEGMFDEGQADLAFRIAETRLKWMERWLIPGFSLATALYLAAVGLWQWMRLPSSLDSGRWPSHMVNLPLGMIITAIVMLFLFLFSRFASGMGRVPEWRLLRACGSYMVGNAVAAMALIVCLGVLLYANVASWERVLAYVIPIVMMVLAAEFALNFVLDIYRPRGAAAEPRAAFDSRLLALLSEPGGIAHSIAEAMNYQFGFQVSHTWFYQLLQRAFLPLLGVAALALWALTSVVIVQPGEHAIVERFGKQVAPEKPLTPGVYWKLPWPMSVVRKYETGRVHQLVIGFQDYDAEPKEDKHGHELVLWTDTTHMGQQHFNFLIPPKGYGEAIGPTTRPVESEEAQAAPVHIMRMDVVVQYTIDADRLAEYTQNVSRPEDTLRNLAWTEVVRFTASTDADTLLGAGRKTFGETLRKRVAEEAQRLKLGLSVVYVGVENVHPEKSVAEAYRNVVTADQERISAIRGARVEETKRLADAAGSRFKALSLLDALEQIRMTDQAVRAAEGNARAADAAAVTAVRERVAALEPQIHARMDADWALEQATRRHRDLRESAELGLGGTSAERRAAAEAEREAQAAREKALAAQDALLTPIRQEFAGRLTPEALDAAIRLEFGRISRAFWDKRLEQQIATLEGKASATLAAAQAERWVIEMKVAGEAARLENEREVFRAVPEIYKHRTFLQTLVEGIRDARKYVLAYDPTRRNVTLRILAEEKSAVDIGPQVRPKRD